MDQVIEHLNNLVVPYVSVKAYVKGVMVPFENARSRTPCWQFFIPEST